MTHPRQDTDASGGSAHQADASDVVLSVDAMGGDNGPAAVVAGLLLFLGKMPDARVILHGPAEQLEPLVAKSRHLSLIHI